MTHRKGTIEMIVGLLLFAAALLLTAYNLWENKNAEQASADVLTQLVQVIPTTDSVPVPTPEVIDLPDPVVGMPIEEVAYPDYILNPQMDMPEKQIDGLTYIGILEIPDIEVSLPVLSEYVYGNLRYSPCRYQGSAYTDDLVICAHNYASHFGSLKNLSVGDTLTLTDIDGNEFRYEVREIIVLDPYAIEEFTESGYALLLFTCTVGGESRVAVRCDKITD